MPIETVEDVAEYCADQAGIYGSPTRCEWVSDLIQRINKAVRTEQAIERGQQENLRSNRIGNGHPDNDPMNDPPSLR